MTLKWFIIALCPLRCKEHMTLACMFYCSVADKGKSFNDDDFDPDPLLVTSSTTKQTPTTTTTTTITTTTGAPETQPSEVSVSE